MTGKWVGFGRDFDLNTGPWTLELITSTVTEETLKEYSRPAQPRATDLGLAEARPAGRHQPAPAPLGGPGVIPGPPSGRAGYTASVRLVTASAARAHREQRYRCRQ
jgi:hypothetical protein